jgi:L-asparaginase II
MNVEPLVVVTREPADAIGGGKPLDPRAVENVHYGSIAVTTVDGGLKYWAGDPHWSTFTRSTLKPFQALAFVREGGHVHFDWSSRQVALMCASHSGEPMHTEVVATMLASADCDTTQLQCGCHVPGWYAAQGRTPPADAHWSPIQHNCSGKHAGFLAACRLHREPVDSYLAPSSALQRRVAGVVSDLAGLAQHDMPSGTDGCSAPNYALPLSRLAHLYGQLAQGAMAPKEGESLGVLFDAMTQHPELVSGTARSDLALMSTTPGDWVTKVGADGVQAIGIRSAGIGIAIKISDGNRDALYCAVIEVLTQLDLIERDDVRDNYAPWLRSGLLNTQGLATGRILPAFTLRAA